MNDIIQIHLPISVGELKKVIDGCEDCTIIDRARSEDIMQRIKDALFEATGLSFEECITEKQYRIHFYVKMIFANKVRELDKTYDNIQIAKLINRDHTSVNRYFSKYKSEIKYNPEFRALLKRVELILNNNVSE